MMWSTFGLRVSGFFRASGFGFRIWGSAAGAGLEGMNVAGNPIFWSVFVACLAVSFVLSGMEAGVFVLSRLRIRQQMRAGQASAKVLHDYLEHPENFLWTILVGNTVANFLILGWLVARLHEALGDHRVWFAVVFAVAVFLFYTFFDLLPKMLFRMYPNRLCVLLARPFRFIHLGVASVGGAGGGIFGSVAAAAGREGLYGAPVRQPGGAAAGDAGIGAGVHVGGAGDDQPRAGLADAVSKALHSRLVIQHPTTLRRPTPQTSEYR